MRSHILLIASVLLPFASSVHAAPVRPGDIRLPVQGPRDSAQGPELSWNEAASSRGNDHEVPRGNGKGKGHFDHGNGHGYGHDHHQHGNSPD